MERKINSQHSQLALEDSAYQSQYQISKKAQSHYEMHSIQPENIKIINLQDNKKPH